MEILVTRGVVVDAESIREALDKTEPAEGVTVSINAIPRPQGQGTMTAPAYTVVHSAQQKLAESKEK